jgi:hypothetical protein
MNFPISSESIAFKAKIGGFGMMFGGARLVSIEIDHIQLQTRLLREVGFVSQASCLSYSPYRLGSRQIPAKSA